MALYRLWHHHLFSLKDDVLLVLSIFITLLKNIEVTIPLLFHPLYELQLTFANLCKRCLVHASLL